MICDTICEFICDIICDIKCDMICDMVCNMKCDLSTIPKCDHTTSVIKKVATANYYCRTIMLLSMVFHS